MSRKQDSSPEKELNELQIELIGKYTSLVEKGIFYPSRKDLKDVGATRDMVRHHFSTYAFLRKKAIEYDPSKFLGQIDIDMYTSDEYLAKIEKAISTYKRFLIATAVAGQKVDSDFLKAAKKYCKYNDAKLLILPSHDPAHNLDQEIDWFFDPALLDDDILLVFEETRMNSNFFISGIRVTAKQINPITGLNELSQQKGSFVSASPKQFLEFDSVSASKFPHGRMTSGSITLPNYKSSLGNSLRSSYIAEFQHTMGALVVEIMGNKSYSFRTVQFTDGVFCDLGVEYGPKKGRFLKGEEAPALVIGDYHAGEHDDTAVGAWIEVINQLGVETVLFHDMFNGVSVGPHDEDNMVVRAERAAKGLHSLETELRITSTEFDRILSLPSVKEGIVVKSNHDDMLDRWISKAKFAKDPINFQLGSRLAGALTNSDKDYLKEALSIVSPPKHMDKIRWLKMDEDYLIGGVHLGAHGDKAANGSKGSIKSLAKSYPKCVIGHSHTPGIFKGAFQVGTTSLRRLGYNRGPSSWVHCSCLVYRNGQRQLINSFDGTWRGPNNARDMYFKGDA